MKTLIHVVHIHASPPQVYDALTTARSQPHKSRKKVRADDPLLTDCTRGADHRLKSMARALGNARRAAGVQLREGTTGERSMKKTLAVVVVVSGLAMTVTAGQPGLTEPVQVLPRDAIPAIDDPRFESVAEADRYLADNELMIGLVGETEQRAYSTWQLDRHEIVNDVFEGRPIAVTW